ncbi:hypothetical protein B0H14DRAFT_3168741 [Mycena olivaceomarginata]|nr:hypothetical protein B0H14DRAFT_3168741 [Mycena olivaceomarginata]
MAVFLRDLEQCKWDELNTTILYICCEYNGASCSTIFQISLILAFAASPTAPRLSEAHLRNLGVLGGTEDDRVAVLGVGGRVEGHPAVHLVDRGLRRLAYRAALERSQRLRNLGVLGGIEDDRRLETAEAKATQRLHAVRMLSSSAKDPPMSPGPMSASEDDFNGTVTAGHSVREVGCKTFGEGERSRCTHCVPVSLIGFGWEFEET